MRPQELKAFIAVCKYNSFSMAAEKLFMTQPTISWLIQSLEKEWGKSFFTRGKGVRSVSLTKAGQIFYPQAERFLQLWEETEMMISDENKDMFHFACTPSVASLILPAVNRIFHQQSPQCRLYLDVDKSWTLFHAVEQGSIDCALVCQIQPTSQINVLPFASEKLVFVCREDAKYNDSLSICDLNVSDEVYIPATDALKTWHKEHFPNKKIPSVTISVSFSLKDCFIDRNSWAIIPVSQLHLLGDNFRVCKLDVLPNDRMFYLISKTTINKKYYSNLIQTIRHSFLQIDGIKIFIDEV